MPSCLPLGGRPARLLDAALLASWIPSCSPLGYRPARLLDAALLASWILSCSILSLSPDLLLDAVLVDSQLQPCSPLGCRPARLLAAALLASWIPSCSILSFSPARLSAAALLAVRPATVSMRLLWRGRQRSRRGQARCSSRRMRVVSAMNKIQLQDGTPPPVLLQPPASRGTGPLAGQGWGKAGQGKSGWEIPSISPNDIVSTQCKSAQQVAGRGERRAELCDSMYKAPGVAGRQQTT